MSAESGAAAPGDRAALRIEIDELPSSLTTPTAADYVGRQICSALVRPLVRWDRRDARAVPRAARRWLCSDDGLRWAFELDPEARWSDGRAVTAADALDGILAAREHATWARHLRCLASADATDPRVLVLELRHPFHPLLALLAVPDLGPRRDAGESLPRLGNGPYLLAGASAACIELVPNPAVAGARPPLQFPCNRDPASSTAGFLAGRFDVTSSTGFPLGELARWRGDPCYRTRPTGIVMQLELAPHGPAWLRDPAVRRALLGAIDREAIAASLEDGIDVAGGWGPACFPGLRSPLLAGGAPAPAAPAPAGVSAVRGRSLRLMLNDYEPNGAIAAAVARHWRDGLGLHTELVHAAFEDVARDDFDVLLALRYPTFPTPWATVEHLAQLVAALDPAAFELQRALMRGWLRGPAGAPMPLADHALALDAVIPVLPLFELRGHWLQRASARGFEYPDDGYFDYPEDL